MSDDKVLDLIEESMTLMSSMMMEAIVPVLYNEVGEKKTRQIMNEVIQKIEDFDMYAPIKELYFRHRN